VTANLHSNADVTGTTVRPTGDTITDFPNLGLTYHGGWCLATYSDETPITRPSCEVNV